MVSFDGISFGNNTKCLIAISGLAVALVLFIVLTVFGGNQGKLILWWLYTLGIVMPCNVL